MEPGACESVIISREGGVIKDPPEMAPYLPNFGRQSPQCGPGRKHIIILARV